MYGAAMQGWFQRAPVFKGPGYQGDEAKTQEVGLGLSEDINTLFYSTLYMYLNLIVIIIVPLVAFDGI